MTVKELDADQLARWLSSGESIRLIDVRTPSEASRGIIPDAENLVGPYVIRIQFSPVFSYIQGHFGFISELEVIGMLDTELTLFS